MSILDRIGKRVELDSYSRIGNMRFVFLAILAGLFEPGIAADIPAPRPAENSLAVSIKSPLQRDEYLTTQVDKAADKFVNCLVRVHADGNIERIFCTDPYDSPPRAIHRLRDYRDHNGKEWFFDTHIDKTGTSIAESCVLGANRKVEHCFSMKWLDSHDVLFADNGDRIYMFYVPRVKQHVWISGKALDLVLRRVNSRDEVVWEWSSADHPVADVKEPPRKKGFISEVANYVKLVRTSILTSLGASGDPICVPIMGRQKCVHMHWVDYLHANSLAWDRDGGIIVSARHASEVFKVNYPDGNVAWIFGGYAAQHQDFKFLNDPLNGFSFQHSAKILPNGNMLMYDNGNGRPDQRSRAVEYKFDLDRRTAMLVWSHSAPEDFRYRDCCGGVQRLENGNTLIAWGGLGDKKITGSFPVASEVTADGKIVFELRSNVPALPYRVWKIEK